ncbi:hypothetical protein ScPMuIL_003293 [Solemya velum]
MTKKATWNLLQVGLIAVYPAYVSYIRMVRGMSLLAVYVFLITLCIPPLFIQLKIGGHGQKGIVGLLSKHFPIAKGVGIALLIDLFFSCIYIAPLVMHVGVYAFISIIEQPYVWGECDHEWNTNFCLKDEKEIFGGFGINNDVQIIAKEHMRSPEEEFYRFEFLELSGGINDIQGFPVWGFTELVRQAGITLMPFALIAVWLLVFLVIAFGGNFAGWVFFILGPSFITILLAVLGYGYSNLDKDKSNNFLQYLYDLNFKGILEYESHEQLINDWLKGFYLLSNSLPVWTAIPATIGKMAGVGRISRNITWLLMIMVYGAVCQIPFLAMAPYLGNNIDKDNEIVPSTYEGMKVVFVEMPRAFSNLEIPPVYALLFYLSLFISGIMFLCIAMFTIVDNIVDALTKSFVNLSKRRCCVNVLTSLIMIVITASAGLLHTTKAGMYYILLMDQSVPKLRFITVIIMAFILIIVYGKQNFAIAERIMMSIWCFVAALCAAGFWLYSFITTIEPIGYGDHVIPDTWELIGWLIAAFPFVAIPAAAIHGCMMMTDGSCSERIKYLCGENDDSRRSSVTAGYVPAEPSAPPFDNMYTDHTFPMNDVPYKHHTYEHPELEPLNTYPSLHSSQI